MSRNALIASLAGAIALGLSAFSAQAASVPRNTSGVHSGKASLVQQAHYRHYRHHRHHRHHRHYRHHRNYR
jgi:hypothetical protein